MLFWWKHSRSKFFVSIAPVVVLCHKGGGRNGCYGGPHQGVADPDVLAAGEGWDEEEEEEDDADEVVDGGEEAPDRPLIDRVSQLSRHLKEQWAGGETHADQMMTYM